GRGRARPEVGFRRYRTGRVAGELRVHGRPARARVLFALEHQHRRAFAEDHTVAVVVEGARPFMIRPGSPPRGGRGAGLVDVEDHGAHFGAAAGDHRVGVAADDRVV